MDTLTTDSIDQVKQTKSLTIRRLKMMQGGEDESSESNTPCNSVLLMSGAIQSDIKCFQHQLEKMTHQTVQSAIWVQVGWPRHSTLADASK